MFFIYFRLFLQCLNTTFDVVQHIFHITSLLKTCDWKWFTFCQLISANVTTVNITSKYCSKLSRIDGLICKLLASRTCNKKSTKWLSFFDLRERLIPEFNNNNKEYRSYEKKKRRQTFSKRNNVQKADAFSFLLSLRGASRLMGKGKKIVLTKSRWK